MVRCEILTSFETNELHVQASSVMVGRGICICGWEGEIRENGMDADSDCARHMQDTSIEGWPK